MKKVLLLLCCISAMAVFARDRQCDNNTGRSWWDVQRYTITTEIDTASGYLNGYVIVEATIPGKAGDTLQIDLQEPMSITDIQSVPELEGTLRWVRDGNAYYVTGDFKSLPANSNLMLAIGFEGTPKVARHAPWDGGIVLSRDNNGKRWIGLACQGNGASIWFPCKNFQGDEPDKGAMLSMVVPYGLTVVSNGQCTAAGVKADTSLVRWAWKVDNPINNYDISFYIGDYVHWSDTLKGISGNLPLDFYVLRDNLAKAQKQFRVVKPMLQCFEEKLGPYPFYNDGYKLVDAPYLGMEHQSAIAYGNQYKMGYLGIDRSGTKAGLDFDYIIIHESGHEWFGNNITTFDKADTWVHEGFTTYTETIFEECLKGKERAFLYQQGKKHLVRNDRPVQGAFHLCDEGSGDHYEKGAFLVHMIRMIMNDDARFFGMLREMNARFYHRIVNGKDVEAFMTEYSGIDLSKIFDQYLRQSQLPGLELRQGKNKLSYRWTSCVAGFNMPVRVKIDGRATWINPLDTWQELPVTAKKVKVDENFLVDSE
jgi:aminopeptidase N